MFLRNDALYLFKHELLQVTKFLHSKPIQEWDSALGWNTDPEYWQHKYNPLEIKTFVDFPRDSSYLNYALGVKNSYEIPVQTL